jgi:RNA polymerase sigma-70 factor (ECF subfamily)
VERDTFDAAMERDPDALCSLVRSLLPVIKSRVRRALSRAAARRGIAPGHHDGDDLVQDVLVALFEKDARTLRAWDDARGASLVSFVGIVADHRIASILRSHRRRRCLSSLGDDLGELALEGAADPSAPPDARAVSRDLGSKLLQRLNEELSPRSFGLFVALFVDRDPVPEVCARWGMTPRAVWARRCRLKKRIRQLAGEIDPPGPDALAGQS